MKYGRGFTVIELMITIVILAILVSLAVPSFATAIKNSRASSDVNGLTSALGVARAEAIKRNGLACVSSAGWASGWQVRVVTDRAGNCSSPSISSAPIVRTFDGVQTGAGVTVLQGTIPVTSIDFDGSGARSGSSAYTIAYRSVAGTCNPAADWDITINATGHPSVVKCTQ